MTPRPPVPFPGHDPPRARGLGFLVLLLLLGGLACGAGEEEAPSTDESPPASAAAEPASDTASGPTLHLTDFRSSEPPSPQQAFAHGPHGVVECATCHPAPAGHATHGTVDCVRCHTDPGVRVQVTADSDCAACHHAPDQEVACAGCHGSVGARPTVDLTRSLTVAGTERTRPLPFLHARHPSVSCGSCHGPQVSVVEEVACVSCHEEHHRPEADCSGCHAPPPETAHDRDAHRGCSGSGCHVDPTVPRVRGMRPACLSCHVELRDHKEGRPCAPCHQLTGLPGGGR